MEDATQPQAAPGGRVREEMEDKTAAANRTPSLSLSLLLSLDSESDGSDGPA